MSRLCHLTISLYHDDVSLTLLDNVTMMHHYTLMMWHWHHPCEDNKSLYVFYVSTTPRIVLLQPLAQFIGCLDFDLNDFDWVLLGSLWETNPQCQFHLIPAKKSRFWKNYSFTYLLFVNEKLIFFTKINPKSCSIPFKILKFT